MEVQKWPQLTIPAICEEAPDIVHEQMTVACIICDGDRREFEWRGIGKGAADGSLKWVQGEFLEKEISEQKSKKGR